MRRVTKRPRNNPALDAVSGQGNPVENTLPHVWTLSCADPQWLCRYPTR
jgi:hypothetical protein